MEKLNSAKGAPPLYLQISEILRNKILTKEYAFDTIIPSETELQGMYQVSRITARQAIQELEKDGLVSRARGKGTVVIYQKHIEEDPQLHRRDEGAGNRARNQLRPYGTGESGPASG